MIIILPEGVYVDPINQTRVAAALLLEFDRHRADAAPPLPSALPGSGARG